MAIRSTFTAAGIAAVATVAIAAAAPARAQAPFPDVPAGHWAAEAVAKMAGEGILTGYPPAAAPRPKATPFDGNKPVTRYELAVTLWRFVRYLNQADGRKKGNLGAQLPDAKSPQDALAKLVSGGYLPKNTPLAKEGGKNITASELADAMAQIITKVTEKKTPITPESRRAPISRPI